RIAIRSASRKMPELSGTFRPVVEPAVQSAVPAALAVIVLMTQLLVAAPWWERFGIGSGGPNRQPAFVHCRNLHVAAGQSAPVVNEALDAAPPSQRHSGAVVVVVLVAVVVVVSVVLVVGSVVVVVATVVVVVASVVVVVATVVVVVATVVEVVASVVVVLAT